MTGAHNSKNVRVLGLRHLALKVTNLARSLAFYQNLFSMEVVWQPDGENVYLSSGVDNLALHQIPAHECEQHAHNQYQFLDHFGFIMDSPESVDRLYEFVTQEQVPVVKLPKRHRDGSYSFYLEDPDKIVIQILYEPIVSGLKLETAEREINLEAPLPEEP